MTQGTCVPINATARQARKLMIAKAKARYAVNAAGRRHLKDLVQRKKASNTSLSAELHIAKMRNDLGYFQHRPTERFTGREVLHHAPKYVKARVLKASSMAALTGVSVYLQDRLMEQTERVLARAARRK